MDEQTLERLMIDDALGALPPDVRALLMAFVRTRADGEKGLSRWQSLGTAAQASVHAEEITPPPMRVLQVARFRYVARMTGSAAAILAIGFALGIGARPKPVLSTPTISAAAPVIETAPVVPANSGFWSSQRLMAAALKTEQHAITPRPITWPAYQPNTGETR